MRFEAKHQGIKRKIKAVGFRNVMETIPRLMNESRKCEIESLGLLNGKNIPAKKNLYYIGKLRDETKIFKVMSVNKESLNVTKIQTNFCKKLLAYKIKSYDEPEVIESKKIEIKAGGSLCKFGGFDYILFFEFFENEI